MLNLLLGRLAEATLPGAFLLCGLLCAAAMGLFGLCARQPRMAVPHHNA